MAFVVAEIGCNHQGDIGKAKEMIRAAGEAGATVVKFQKRNPKSLPPEIYFGPHPNPEHSYGATYGEHREFLEFTAEQHAELKKECEAAGVIYSTSVWDMPSAMQILELQPEMIKIPSARNKDFQLIRWLCQNFAGQIHISTGMSRKDDVSEIVRFLQDRGRASDVVLYACTSGYPVDFKDVCLLEIDSLRQLYGKIVNAIGFSGHHFGIAIDNAALALGAIWIERHFTLDRRWKGTDQSASLEPLELKRLVTDLSATDAAMNYKPHSMLAVELEQAKKLKYEHN